MDSLRDTDKQYQEESKRPKKEIKIEEKHKKTEEKQLNANEKKQLKNANLVSYIIFGFFLMIFIMAVFVYPPFSIINNIITGYVVSQMAWAIVYRRTNLMLYGAGIGIIGLLLVYLSMILNMTVFFLGSIVIFIGYALIQISKYMLFKKKMLLLNIIAAPLLYYFFLIVLSVFVWSFYLT